MKKGKVRVREEKRKPENILRCVGRDFDKLLVKGSEFLDSLKTRVAPIAIILAVAVSSVNLFKAEEQSDDRNDRHSETNNSIIVIICHCKDENCEHGKTTVSIDKNKNTLVEVKKEEKPKVVSPKEEVIEINKKLARPILEEGANRYEHPEDVVDFLCIS